jgi:hypothetical protein
VTRHKVLLAFAVLAVAALAVAAGAEYVAARQQAEREAAYAESIQAYRVRFRVGISRAEAEEMLRDGGMHFQQVSGAGLEEKTYSDLIKIGQEPKPWYCSEHNVYIALQFTALDQSKPFDRKPSDVLKRITLFKWLEGCL